jgi:hypothetical protein
VGDARIKNICGDTKFAQMTPNKTFLGLGDNRVFRVDPRLRGDKLVERES